MSEICCVCKQPIISGDDFVPVALEWAHVGCMAWEGYEPLGDDEPEAA